MEYKVIVSKNAEQDMEEFVRYLLFEKKSEQAAVNLLDDFEATVLRLSQIAGNLKYCENKRLKAQGYRRINFQAHRYFVLYRVEGNKVFVDDVFHELQDYENRMI